MKRRKISAGILAVILSAGLTACGGGQQAGNTAVTETEAQSTETQMTEMESTEAQSTEASAAEIENTEIQSTETTISETETETVPGETLAVVTIEDSAVPLYDKPASGSVRQPQASGTVVYENNKVIVDASNTSQGYVMVKYTGSNGAIKVQITRSGKETYTYDLKARDAYEVFPLSEGNGTYSVKVFENITGNQYAQAFSQDLSVSISDQFAPFLYPNQYVNFNANSAVVQTGASITAGITDPIQVVSAIYNYVVTNFTYDTAKAATVKSGYLPNVDTVLAQKTGICFDYAAVMTAMLRSQNIPTKLVVGYTGSVYHAWVNVYIDNVGWVDGMIFFDGTNWQLMDPTFASSGKQSPEIMQYIGNASNYQAKFLY